MNDWTPEARTLFREWIAEHEPTWRAEGAEVEELREDLREHIETELGGTITEASLAPLLGRLSPGESLVEEIPSTGGTTRAPWTRNAPSDEPLLVPKSRLAWLREPKWWGAWWPGIILIFEALVGFCGNTVFDPIPTWLHLLLVAFAVGAGFYLFYYLQKRDGESGASKWLGPLAAGFAIVIAIYYAAIFLPLLIMGTIGGVLGTFYTFGLLIPMVLLGIAAAASPIFFGFSIHSVARKLGYSWKQMLTGLAVGLVALLAVEGPGYITRIALPSGNAPLVRTLGSERVLLEACYEGNARARNGLDTTGWVFNGWRGLMRDVWGGSGRVVKAEDARELYYRVTGNSFNSVDSPGRRRVLGSDRGGELDWEWDPALGGDAVAARLKYLDLESSRLDGHLEAASGIGYWEWTLVFENRSQQAKEARMQVLLPPEGVVSRVTLWVNDEPQEAAFGAKGKVTEAYQSVAVVQRRDPVLVRWISPDRVLVQCFPVPANGEMKIRLGISAPPDDLGRLALPRLIERNFGLVDDGTMSVWLQGDTPVSIEGIEGGSQKDRWHETHGEIPLGRLDDPLQFANIPTGHEKPLVWAPDPFAKKGEPGFLVRRRVEVTAAAKESPVRLHVVVDGSASMAGWGTRLAKALEDLGHVEEVYLATDHGFAGSSLANLEGFDFAGGRNNLPALRAAVEASMKGGDGHEVLWIHGPQPVEFSGIEGFEQLLERAFRRPMIHDLQVVPGPNRLLEEMSELLSIRPSLRIASPEDLDPALARIAGKAFSSSGYEWETLAEAPDDPSAVKVGDQLIRYRAWKRLLETGLRSADQPETDLIADAVRYQLVTPWTGAVVLERKEQYKDFDLEQIDASTAPGIPTIPEPSGALLVLIMALLAMLPRRRGRGF